MGFALWVEDEIAWAQGTHEYRPMGTAVIGSRTLFAARDFRPSQPSPSRDRDSYIGLFASIGEMNDYLRRRRSQGRKKIIRKHLSRTFRIV
jgi:hypothetical protein